MENLQSHPGREAAPQPVHRRPSVPVRGEQHRRTATLRQGTAEPNSPPRFYFKDTKNVFLNGETEAHND